MIEAMAGLEVTWPCGPIMCRAIDWRYVDGAAVMPADEEVRALRPES